MLVFAWQTSIYPLKLQLEFNLQSPPNRIDYYCLQHLGTYIL